MVSSRSLVNPSPFTVTAVPPCGAPRPGVGGARIGGAGVGARVLAGVLRALVASARAEQDRESDGVHADHGSVNLTVASWRLATDGSAPITRRKKSSPCACAAATCG